MAKVIIIEPSPVIQQGIKKLLEEESDFNVVNLYGDLQSFQQDKSSSFDIILINPVIINFYKQFSVRALFPEYPHATIVAILYSYVDTETLSTFDGILDIYDDGAKLVKNLQKIIQIENSQPSGSNEENIDLSDREKEILTSVAKGLTNKEIAEKHYISVHTVVSHRKNITRKTGIKTVSGLTIYAILNNLISQDEGISAFSIPKKTG